MSLTLRYIIAAIVAYLLGSVSFGMIIARLSGGPDLHKVGSGNTGATNALRTMGTAKGLMVLLGDAGKAFLACFIGKWLIGTNDTGISYGMLLAGLCVIAGHNWPLFYGFKGGKGAACSCAVALCCFPIQALICIAAGMATVAISRFVSLGSLVVTLLFAILVSVWSAHGDVLVIVWSWILMACLWLRHTANIGRLLKGKENRISFTKHGTVKK